MNSSRIETCSEKIVAVASARRNTVYTLGSQVSPFASSCEGVMKNETETEKANCPVSNSIETHTLDKAGELNGHAIFTYDLRTMYVC